MRFVPPFSRMHSTRPPPGAWSKLKQRIFQPHSDKMEDRSQTSLVAGVLDSLSSPIAVLDPQGGITTANAAWRQFADIHTAAHWASPIGSNYLEAIEDAAQQSGDDEAASAAAGIKAVMAADQRKFELKYACHGSNGKRWFRMAVTPRLGSGGVVIIHYDITQEAREEMRLRRELKVMDLVWDQTSDGICVVDPAGNILNCNVAVEKRVGLDRSALRGRPATDVFEVDVPIDVEASRRRVEEEGQLHIRRRMQFLDGSTRVMEARIFPVRDEAGTLVARIALTHDVSENAQRREMERLYTAIWDQSPHGIAVTLGDGVVVSANPALLRLLECTQTGIVGKNIMDFIAADEVGQPEVFSGASALGSRLTQHCRLLTPSGTICEVEISLSQLNVGAEDTPQQPHVLLTIQDVSALSIAARELIATKDLLGRTEIAAQIGGLDIDYATNSVARTEGIYRIYDIEVKNKATAEVFRNTYWEMPDLADAFKIAAQSLVPWTMELPIHTAKGREIWVSVSGEPRVRGGKVVGVTCLLRDITESKKKLDALRKSEGRIRAMLVDSPIPMFMADAAGTVLIVNRAFTRAFGYTLEDIPTVESWRTCIWPDPAYRAQILRKWEAYKAAREEGPVAPLEAKICTKEGGTSIALTSASWLDTGIVGDQCFALEDITARRAAENAAERSLALLRRTEQISGTGGWSEDLLTGEISCTPEIYRIADVDQDAPNALQELRRVFDIAAVSPPGVETRAQALAGKSWDREFAVVSAKGQRKWVRIRGDCILRDGVVVGIEGHMQDVTSRQRAEQEVARLNTLLHATQVNAKIGGWSFNLTTSAITWTVGLYLIHDLDPDDEAAFEAYSHYLSQNAHPMAVEAMEAAKRNGTPYELEIPRVTAKGRHIWVHTRGEPVMCNGKVEALTGYLQDITIRKEAELKLSQASSQLQATLDATIDGMATIDAHGIISSTNRAMSKIFGYAAEDMIGRNIRILMPDPDQGLHDGYLAHHQNTGQKRIIGIGREVMGRRKDGTVFPLDLAVAELQGMGEHARYLGTVRDITARKAAEDQLRAAQKMEAVGQLTAGVAHDFNNLLAVIAANLELLAEDVEDHPKLAKRIDAALKASDRGGELTQHLLAFGRNQALSPKLHDLCVMVQSSARLLKRTFPGNISIEVIIDPQTPTLALVDDAQLENALLNLGLNARDAMKDGGVLLFCVTIKDVVANSAEGTTAPPTGRYAQITVQDTGMGMSPEILARAFDPFFTTKPVGKGSGLGLSMVYGFVHQSGGHVLVSSAVGRGTTFSLLFPLSEDAIDKAAQANGVAPQASSTVQRRVLLVEDMEDVRSAIEAQLETLGLQVTTAVDATAALALLDVETFDLLLTDLGLPGNIDGDRLADIAAERVPGLKIITMTGYNKDRVIGGAVQKGPNRAHLRKPFKRSEVSEVLRELFP